MPGYQRLFFGSVFFLCGVGLKSAGFDFEILLISTLAILGSIAVWLVIKHVWAIWVAVLICLVPIGALYYQADDIRFWEHTNVPYGEDTEMAGVIISNPTVLHDLQTFHVSLNEPYEGNVRVQTSLWPLFSYGDVLAIQGIVTVPEDDGYRSYLLKQRVSGQIQFPHIRVIDSGAASPIKAVLYDIRNHVTVSFQKLLPPLEASFLNGLTMGGYHEMPTSFKDAMSDSGTTHLVALSGYNISIVILVLMGMLLYVLPRNAAFIGTACGLIGFVIMTGAEASVVRAAVMGGLVLLATRLGRTYDIRNAAVLAALVMVLVNPKVLLFDVGFQLSFLALLGIVYLRPILGRLIKYTDPGILSWRDNLLTTTAAQIAVAPLLLFHFGALSPVSLLANIVILEAIPITMAGGFILAILAAGAWGIAELFGMLIGAVVHLEVLTIEWFGQWGMMWNWEVSGYGICCAYVIGTFLVGYVYRRFNLNQAGI